MRENIKENNEPRKYLLIKCKLGNGMKRLTTFDIGWLAPLLFFYKIGLGIK